MNSSDCDRLKQRLRWVLASAEEIIVTSARRAAQKAARRAYAETMKRLAGAIGDYEVRVQEIESEMAEHLSEVVLKVLSEILKEEFSDRDRVLTSVKRALSHFPWHEHVWIRVSPDSMTMVASHRDEISRVFPGVSMTLEQDPTLLPGEAVVRTRRSQVSMTASHFVQLLREWYSQDTHQ